MELKVLGINSGGGVSLHPFKWDLIGNLEERSIFHTAQDCQWKLNFNQPFWRNYEDCLEYIKKGKIKPNVIISSPDCGSGSILRLSRAKKLGDNKQNKSLKTFFKAIKELKPKFFLFENLETLFKTLSEEEFRKKTKKYQLVIHSRSVADFGNSQITRKRLIIVGIRKKLGLTDEEVTKAFEVPKNLYAPRPCHILYNDLEFMKKPPTGHFREHLGLTITMYSGFRLTIAEIQHKWENEFRGKSRWEVKDRKFSTVPGVYRNLDMEFPSTARKANRQFDSKGYMLTPRQLARIQGVPDNFKIAQDPEKAELGYWINKGRALVTKTPPYEISLWFQDRLDLLIKKLNDAKTS